MRIAIVGARGRLGAAMVHGCAARHDVTAFDRRSLDITDAALVAATLARARPDVIINCTGYNAVDAAEDHPVEALQVNALAVRGLARAATDTGAALVHYSSDFVFDGSGAQPHTEVDRPNPRSVYAASKLLGEWFAADAPRAYVLRVECLFGVMAGASPAKGSVATIVDALKTGGVPRVLEDRTVSPTHIPDAVRATMELVEGRSEPGLYHCVNSGHCTWLEFATEAARLLGVPATFDVVRAADLELRAVRPQYCALSNQKLASVGIVMRTWQDALRDYVQAF